MVKSMVLCWCVWWQSVQYFLVTFMDASTGEAAIFATAGAAVTIVAGATVNIVAGTAEAAAVGEASMWRQAVKFQKNILESRRR
jgi:hypothetical protein